MNRNVPVPFLGEGQRQRWPLTRLRAVVPLGARQGTHVGRVAVKASGYFTIQTKTGKVPDVSSRYCQVQHRTDGYHYHFGVRLPLPPTSSKGAPVSSPA